MGSVEYRIDDFEPAWQKAFFFVSVVLLVLLIPTTALGYFAEKSIPGQPLYAMKRAIETGVLALESVTPYGKSNYLLALADTRVSETSALVESAKVSGDYGQTLGYSDTALAEIVTSVKQAENSIQQISDPVKKQQAQQDLSNAVQKYQNNLQKIAVAAAQQPSTNFVGLENSSTPTPTTTEHTVQQSFLSPTPTEQVPTPTNTPDAPAVNNSQDQLAHQIEQTQQDLQQIQNQLGVTPDPQLLPTPIPTITSTIEPTLTPTPTPQFFKNRHNDSQHGGDNR